MERNCDWMKPKRKLGDIYSSESDLYSSEDDIRKKNPESGGGIIDLLMEKKGMISWQDGV